MNLLPSRLCGGTLGRPPDHSIRVATRDRILAAAGPVFAEHGFARARLADIAAEAGIRRPSLLHHFPTKAVLYAEVVRCTFADLGDQLAGAMAAERTLDAHLRGLIEAFATYLAAHPHHARIVVHELVTPDGPGQAILAEQAGPVLDGVVAFLTAHDAGRLRPGLPLRAAVMQVASDLMLHHAAGPVRGALWGDAGVSSTVHLVQTLFLKEPPP